MILKRSRVKYLKKVFLLTAVYTRKKSLKLFIEITCDINNNL